MPSSPSADISEHSHEIGLANLPFTRRGRKAAAEAAARNKSRNRASADESDSQEETPQPTPSTSPTTAVAGPSNPATASLNGQANGAHPEEDDEDVIEALKGQPKWEGIPQGHAILGALMMPNTDKVALGLLCGLHEMAMQQPNQNSSS